MTYERYFEDSGLVSLHVEFNDEGEILSAEGWNSFLANWIPIDFNHKNLSPLILETIQELVDQELAEIEQDKGEDEGDVYEYRSIFHEVFGS